MKEPLAVKAARVVGPVDPYEVHNRYFQEAITAMAQYTETSGGDDEEDDKGEDGNEEHVEGDGRESEETKREVKANPKAPRNKDLKAKVEAKKRK